jgi:electron transfer flavoprotein alpha subunit
VIFKGILNGCSVNAAAQAQELNGFISRHLTSEDAIGGTILFYSKPEQIEKLLGLVSTGSVALVRIKRYQPENILTALKTLGQKETADLYVFPSGFAGAEIAVRLAFRMNGSSLVQVKHIACSGENLIARKAVYSNHVLGTFKLGQKPFCISLAKGRVDTLPIVRRDRLVVTEFDMTHLHRDRFIKASQWIPMPAARDLAKATFLVIGGKGMHSRENTQKLQQIAEKMGADFGVSRPPAMHAWAPMDRLIGVSGAMTRANVCIVAGVSGAAAFYAGIEKSQFIVAINRDIQAPIVRSADVAIIDDYKAVMDELSRIFHENKDLCFGKETHSSHG